MMQFVEVMRAVDTQRAPARQRRTADERREDVLDAAIIEFATHGLYGASTEAIADRAGISQPYVLRLFGTKKAIFLAAVERVVDQIMDGWANALEHAPLDASPGDKLRMLGERYHQHVDEVNALRLVLQSFSSAEDREVRAMSHHCLKIMHAWVREQTGASGAEIQHFFAIGMMLTVAASIQAAEAAESESWARVFVEIPLREP